MDAHTVALTALMSRDGVRPAQVKLLSALIDKPMSIRVAAEELGVSYANLVQHAKALVRAGLIERRVDERDTRLVQYLPTKAGLDLGNRVRGIVAAAERATLNGDTTE